MSNTALLDLHRATVEAYRAIAPKIARVIEAVDAVEKDKHHAFHNYSYASVSAYLEAVRKPMAQAGLVLLHELEGYDRMEHKTKNGAQQWFYTAVWTFTLICTETGRHISFEVTSQSIDTEDKGLGKALSFALKYFLGALFLIPAGDPEAASEEQGPDDGSATSRDARARQVSTGPRTGPHGAARRSARRHRQQADRTGSEAESSSGDGAAASRPESTTTPAQKLAMKCNAAGLTDQEAAHRVCGHIAGRDITTRNALRPDEIGKCMTAIEKAFSLCGRDTDRSRSFLTWCVAMREPLSTLEDVESSYKRYQAEIYAQ